MGQFGKAKHIHFVGIGGIGMSGIAELLMNLGYEVSGSDLKDSEVTRRLAAAGGKIFKGHDREQIRGADVVVYSSAVTSENPEIREARDGYIPVIPRAEMLAELMRLKHGIAVAGAHGKTTTTSMVASILNRGNLDPTVVIGGRLDIWGGSNAKLGQGEILVAEADESDGSFLALSPTIAVVTNMDHEHMDHYGDMDRIRDTFVDFINKIPFYGTAVICLDNEEIQGILPRLKKRYLTYGTTSQADLRGYNIAQDVNGVRFDVSLHDRPLGGVLVAMPGQHNVQNALAAIGVGLELDLDMAVIREGLENLGGLARRFQVKGENRGILVLDDYGHHPTEIDAVLTTVRESWPERRLIVAFQPHRYSRTKSLFDRFVISFNETDILVVTEIYPAGEDPIEGITGEALVRGIREHGHKEVHFIKNKEDLPSFLLPRMKEGDLLLTLGAGNIYREGERIVEELGR